MRTLKPSIATIPALLDTDPVRYSTMSATTLAANSDHTSHVNAAGTSDEFVVLSGSDPIDSGEFCSDIVRFTTLYDNHGDRREAV
jgi:hypothetical protein